MQHRRMGALVGVAALLTLAACGSGSDDAALPVGGEQPAATQVPTGDDFAASDSTQGTAVEPDTEVPSGDETVGSTDAPADSPAPESAEVVDPPSDQAPAEADASEAPGAAAPAEPVVGGRLFAADVQPAAQFDGNPFPDLVVDDIGKDAQVNIKNILPSDRPVLLWAWAPH